MKQPECSTQRCSTTVDIDRLYQICSNCAVKDLCLPVGFSSSEINYIDQIVKERISLKRKQAIYQTGESFKYLYAIQSGVVKCCRVNYHGDEEIIGFFLPGEIIGLEAIHSGHYENSAVCLENAALCAIELTGLLEVASRLPGLQRQLVNVMSQRLAVRESQGQQRTAEQRVAAFLLSLSYRYHLRGSIADEFILPMSRQDIGQYLNLATETVSRIFTHFQQAGLLHAQGKKLKLLNIKSLEKLAL